MSSEDSRFDNLTEGEQAALLVYIDDKEQEDISSRESDARVYERDGLLTVAEEGYGWINSDTTCADILGGEGDAQ